MSFEIVIKETRTVESYVGKEWVVIGDEEVPREPSYYASNENEPKTRIKQVYGYTPEITKHKTHEREVLKQTVDKLDLAAVIKAINGM